VQLPDGNLELDGLFTKHVDKFANDAKLSGHYSWAGGASGGGTSVLAARGYQFTPEGGFTTSSSAAVSSQTAGAQSVGAAGGTYKLSGNLLELTSAGETKRHVVYPYQLGNNDIRLNIDGEMYKRDR
jgi:hypothetical protein